MNLVQRYIFRKLLGAFLVGFPALAITIWATQALRQLNLVTDRGQQFGVFLEATILLLPGLVLIIGPVTMLIVVIYGLNSLNSDSELISLNASGTSAAILIKPILALAIPVTILSLVCSLYLNPLAARQTNLLIAGVNASVITTLVRPGQFRTLGEDVVIQVKAIDPDGTLRDIFVFDRRLSSQSVAYIARAGNISAGENGQFLLMREGLVQRRPADSDAVSVIQFASYAFDLSTLAISNSVNALRPNERRLSYLFAPDPDDPIHQANPFRYSAELHNRLNVPLYVLVLSLVPAAFLGSARSVRQGRAMITTMAAVVSGLLLGCNLYFGGALENNPGLLPLVYGVPLGAMALAIFVLATGRRPRRPKWMMPLRMLRRRRYRARTA